MFLNPKCCAFQFVGQASCVLSLLGRDGNWRPVRFLLRLSRLPREDRSMAKLSKEEIVTLHVLKEKGESNRAVAKRLGVSDRGPRNPNHHRAILAVSTAFWDAYLGDSEPARAWRDGPAVRRARRTSSAGNSRIACGSGTAVAGATCHERAYSSANRPLRKPPVTCNR